MRVRERMTLAMKFKELMMSLCIFLTQTCSFPTLAALFCVNRFLLRLCTGEYLICNLAWCADKQSSGRRSLWLGITVVGEQECKAVLIVVTMCGEIWSFVLCLWKMLHDKCLFDILHMPSFVKNLESLGLSSVIEQLWVIKGLMVVNWYCWDLNSKPFQCIIIFPKIGSL